MTKMVLTGAQIFDGHSILDDRGLVHADGRILEIAGKIPDDAQVVDLEGGLLAPGFVDAQVNGGGGVQLNDAPDMASIRQIAETHARFGTTSILPTLITDSPDVMAKAIAAVEAAIESGVPGCLGVHLEGPFLCASRKGAHAPEYIRDVTDRDIEILLNARIPTLLVTVAPESASPEQIRKLVAGGVIVSLGHSNAHYGQVKQAVAAGATGITHLFNAMSPLGHRAPGMVGAGLDIGELWCGLIADGHHVDPAAMGIALRAKRGPGRVFLVSDAMCTVGDPGDEFHLNGRVIRRENGRLTLADGTLAGSDLELASAVRFVVDVLHTPLEEALRMASLYPAIFLGRDQEVGRLAPGYRADLVQLDDQLNVISTWIDGERI